MWSSQIWRRVETARRVLEANVAHCAGNIRPPGANGPIGEPEVGSEVAEQVEAHRRRRREIGP